MKRENGNVSSYLSCCSPPPLLPRLCLLRRLAVIFFSFRLQETAPTPRCVKLQRRNAKTPKKRGLGIVTSPVVQLTCVMLAQLGHHYFGFLCCASSLTKCLSTFIVLRQLLAFNNWYTRTPVARPLQGLQYFTVVESVVR